jgi:hypothetical protein
LGWLLWNFWRQFGLGNGGERAQDKNGGSKDYRTTHEGNSSKDISVKY